MEIRAISLILLGMIASPTTSSAPAELPLHSLPLRYNAYVDTRDYDGRVFAALRPDAAAWCFDHLGPHLVQLLFRHDDLPNGAYIQFKSDADMIVFKMEWGDLLKRPRRRGGIVTEIAREMAPPEAAAV